MLGFATYVADSQACVMSALLSGVCLQLFSMRFHECVSRTTPLLECLEHVESEGGGQRWQINGLETSERRRALHLRLMLMQGIWHCGTDGPKQFSIP